jgi:YNFM family putative membrane transporter
MLVVAVPAEGRPPLVILLLTAAAVSILYTPQPLLPLLGELFAVDGATISLLITVAMVPLALAPLLYGYILERVAARPMIVGATVLLAITQLAMALAGSWSLLLLLRIIQGIALPALLTALLTYITAHAPHHQVRSAAAWYVAATIVGGFAGRAVTGAIAELAGWRVAIATWSLLLLFLLVALWRRRLKEEIRFSRITLAKVRSLLAIDRLWQGYLAIFSLFFIFAALLNTLPFRLLELDPTLGLVAIGLAYIGYLSGLVMSLNGQRLARLMGGERQAASLAAALYATGLALFSLPSSGAIYMAMFAVCGGMFLLHTLLSGEVNHRNERYKGVINGLYIAAYYTGGALGSWLPAHLYHSHGWSGLIALLLLLLLVAIVSSYALFRAPDKSHL